MLVTRLQRTTRIMRYNQKLKSLKRYTLHKTLDVYLLTFKSLIDYSNVPWTCRNSTLTSIRKRNQTKGNWIRWGLTTDSSKFFFVFLRHGLIHPRLVSLFCSQAWLYSTGHLASYHSNAGIIGMHHCTWLQNITFGKLCCSFPPKRISQVTGLLYKHQGPMHGCTHMQHT